MLVLPAEGFGIIAGLNDANWQMTNDDWQSRQESGVIGVPVILCNGHIAYRVEVTGAKTAQLDSEPLTMRACLAREVARLADEQQTKPVACESANVATVVTPWKWITRSGETAQAAATKTLNFDNGCKFSGMGQMV